MVKLSTLNQDHGHLNSPTCLRTIPACDSTVRVLIYPSPMKVRTAALISPMVIRSVLKPGSVLNKVVPDHDTLSEKDVPTHQVSHATIKIGLYALSRCKRLPHSVFYLHRSEVPGAITGIAGSRHSVSALKPDGITLPLPIVSASQRPCAVGWTANLLWEPGI